jgi:hypothetical protein
MTPQSAKQDILTQVESATGYPVQVYTDPTLNVLATVKAASANVPFTLVRIRPDLTGITEYIVSFQCGFVLRQAALPVGTKWDIAASFKGRKELDRIVRKSTAGKISESARTVFEENLLGGLITQLRSVPIGLRIDQWIQERYPVLAEQQRVSIQRQLDDNLAVLSPAVKRMAPERIYSASAGMNAAAALYWSMAWNDNTVSVPYKVSGFADIGEKLITRFDELGASSEFDRVLIDSWSNELEISGWHEFISR